MDHQVVLSGTGYYVPPHAVSNDALVESFNTYSNAYNAMHKKEIEAGLCEPMPFSTSEFIEKASGIKTRYFVEPEGVLNPERMRPFFPARKDEEMSLQCEMAYKAAWAALDQAEVSPDTIDLIILSCSNTQRPYPAISIELQAALGATGYAFDMNVACSSATFAMNIASAHILSGQASRVLIVSPEIASGHLDFTNRDAHFIFSDMCTAVILERADLSRNPKFSIESTRVKTQYSNNIRNNFGFLSYAETKDNQATGPVAQFFKQNGRKVFKEVVPLAAEHILAHIKNADLQPQDIKRFWLHQANLSMNQLIVKKILGREASPLEAPSILGDYANTGAAGSILAFHLYHNDLQSGDWGIISSFGAGYSVGSLLVKKL